MENDAIIFIDESCISGIGQDIYYELKNKQITINGKTYKKISNDYEGEKILDQEKMTREDILGEYINTYSHYYIFIEETSAEEMVSVVMCDSLGAVMGREDVPYTDFFAGNEVQIALPGLSERDSATIYFMNETSIVSSLFMEEYVRVTV